jgi:hypothetical protein
VKHFLFAGEMNNFGELKEILKEEDSKQKRSKRLERNRESARKSRKRKKYYVNYLETKLQTLAREAEHLRQTLKERRMQDPNLVSREQLLRQALITQTGIEEAVDSVKQKYSVGHLYRKENIEGIINEALDIHVPNFTKIIIASLHEPKLNFPELTTEQIEVMLNEKPRVIQENNRISDGLEHIQEVKQKLVGLSEWASKFPEKLSEFLSLEEVTQVMLALEQQISNS